MSGTVANGAAARVGGGTPAARSYTSTGQGLGGTLREFRDLYRGVRAAAKTVGEDVEKQLAQRGLIEETFERLTGRAARGLTVVEIGAGQSLRQARCMAQHNKVIATDLDMYADGLNVRAYVEIAKRNGVKRALKTAGLRLVGNDRAFNRRLREVLGLPRLPVAEFRQMDATRLGFEDDSIDLAYSFHVFEHLPEPEKVFTEAKRVVRPGGMVFTHLHLYTSDSGCHDLRIIRGDHTEIGHWPHLRESERGKVRNAAYLNEIRLGEWIAMLDRVFGAYDLRYVREDELRPEMERLRAAGELAGYGDDELLIKNVIAAWVKPGGGARNGAANGKRIA
ncbi:MAG: class I SAM-dependent methyltransferase [Phycisphaeraceae bacterium]|nr:class I SAM-dependent methyltransferase [Phycisphaeraceae bacterium]